MRRFRVLLLVPAVLFPLFLQAQTTGSVVGRVTDDTGTGLPGVAVEAKSSALQGIQIVVTRGDGSYRLTLLPPGTYMVSASLTGFGRAEETVVVQLDRTAAADFRLRATAKEEVVVTGEAPVVDTTSAAVGTNLNTRQIETLPSGRNYTSLVQVSPGVTTQSSNTEAFAGGIVVYGSSSLENSYVIDGVNTSGVEYGAQGKELNFEFIQEIDVKTGGYQAEYGRSTGGIINVITKSGGNEFHGDFFGYYDKDSLQANNKHKNETLFGTNLGFKRYDYGLDLGGYIVKDQLWFFGAYDRVKNTVTNQLTSGPNAGADVDSDSKRNLGAGKITWKITPSHSFVASFFQDPRVDTGAINDGAHTLNGPFSTFEGRQDFGGRDYSGRYNGVFGSLIAAAQISLHEERNSVGPATTEGDTIEFIDTRNNSLQSGGFGLVQKKNFKRYFYGASLAGYFGNHEVKGGFEYQRETAEVIKRESGGQLVTIFDNPSDPTMPVYQHFYWSVSGASLPDNVPISQLNARPFHRSDAVYLQDSWTVLPNLTANLGIRWDRQQIYDSTGAKQIDLKKDYAPRIGVIWDPTKDRRTKVFGSFGRFYEEIPMDLVIRSFSFEQQPVIYNFDPTSNVPNDTAAGIASDANKVLGGFTEPADPNLHSQYVREFLLGAEREVIPNLAVGVKYIYRNYGEVIEDFLCRSDGTYCIGNPGEGIMTRNFTLGFLNTPPDLTTFPAPKAVRIYRGVQLDVTKRFADNWSMIASYLWSKLDGIYDGEFAPFTQPRGTADPNISAAYDYYDFFTNGKDLTRITSRGPLSNDRRSQFKVSGIYVTPFQLAVGLSAYYRTGTPVSRLGFSNTYSRYEFFLTDRGSEGRVPADYEADLHLGYPLAVGPVTVNFLLDVFSLLDAQRSIFLDERYNLSQFDDNTYVCGTAPGSADEARCNPYFKKPLQRTSPRQLRLGVRVSF